LEVARERAGLAERAAPPARPELPPRRQRRLEPQLALFKRRYARKRPTKRSGGDPNDRRYSRRLEAKIRRMDPLELDELLNGPYD